MSQPPYGSSWPPQQPEPGWGGQQPQYPDPTQPLPPYQPPQYPNPTQPLPPYQPPAPPLGGQWGGQPPYQPPGPPGPPAPPSPPGPPWGQPPRRNTTMIVVLAIVGVLVVGGGVTGLILATRSDKKHDSQTNPPPTPTTQTNQTGGGSSAPDFPTGGVSTDTPTDVPTDLPTDSVSSGGDGSSDQLTIAHNAETVVNALGNDKPTAFCPLVDPTDLKRLLTEKHLDTCSEIKLNSSSDKAEYREYAIEDPSAIEVSGNTAEIPADAVTPVGVGSVAMRRDTDGNWKFRFYS